MWSWIIPDVWANNMNISILLLCLFSQIVDGVYKEVKEGESIILPTDVTKSIKYHIIWKFESIHIADIYPSMNDLGLTNYVKAEIFGGRLQVDFTTGSLTIRNATSEDSGLYLNIVYPSRRTTSKTFNVTVSSSFIPLVRESRNCSPSSERSSVTYFLFFCFLFFPNWGHATTCWMMEEDHDNITEHNFQQRQTCLVWTCVYSLRCDQIFGNQYFPSV